MTKVAFFLSVFSLSILQASSDYQLKHVLGDWHSFDESPFRNDGVRIAGESGILALRYCDLWKLRYEGECQKSLKWEGTLIYSKENDAMLVSENSSPTPTYYIKIDEKDPNKHQKDWGSRKILFYKIR